MRLTFLGATHEVTGSCYYLEAAGKKFLVDCGMERIFMKTSRFRSRHPSLILY